MLSSLNHFIMKNPFFLFIICLSIFLGCEKEELTLPQDETQAVENYAKAANDCRFNDFKNVIHEVEICGTVFAFHVSLQLVNQGNFHRVQAVARCYKQGGDPVNFIDYGEIEVEVNGEMHVWCDIPLNIQVPSDYNINLVGGQVPFRNHCDDCGFNVVTLEYFKNVSVITNEDLIKANFRLKLSECGAVVEKFATLEL
jgi:hypothetical protein